MFYHTFCFIYPAQSDKIFSKYCFSIRLFIFQIWRNCKYSKLCFYTFCLIFPALHGFFLKYWFLQGCNILKILSNFKYSMFSTLFVWYTHLCKMNTLRFFFRKKYELNDCCGPLWFVWGTQKQVHEVKRVVWLSVGWLEIVRIGNWQTGRTVPVCLSCRIDDNVNIGLIIFWLIKAIEARLQGDAYLCLIPKLSTQNLEFLAKFWSPQSNFTVTRNLVSWKMAFNDSL